MIKKSQILALAYKRYIQDKEYRLTPEEMFSQTFNVDCNDLSFSYFKELCIKMDENESLKIFEDLKKSVEESQYKELIEETTKEIIQQNLPDEKKHTWVDIFKHIERRMIEADTRINTIEDKKSKIKVIFDLANTKYIEDIDLYKAKEIKEKLCKLPRNAMNYNNATLQTLLNNDHDKYLSIDTINAYILSATQIYDIAIEEGIDIKNPFKTLRIKKTKAQKRESVNNRYTPFTSKEIKKIFDPKNYASPNDIENFYIPLIALCQGMRANEICQLTVSDIVKATKSKYAILIHEDINSGKKTKNTSSNRVIPISPILEKLGFIDYIKYRKQHDRNGRVFLNCKIDKRGYFSKYISNNFKKYLNKLNIKNGTKVFHSFRHNFRTFCANFKFSSELSNALGGWSSKCVGESYANGFNSGIYIKL